MKNTVYSFRQRLVVWQKPGFCLKKLDINININRYKYKAKHLVSRSVWKSGFFTFCLISADSENMGKFPHTLS